MTATTPALTPPAGVTFSHVAAAYDPARLEAFDARLAGLRQQLAEAQAFAASPLGPDAPVAERVRQATEQTAASGIVAELNREIAAVEAEAIPLRVAKCYANAYRVLAEGDTAQEITEMVEAASVALAPIAKRLAARRARAADLGAALEAARGGVPFLHRGDYMDWQELARYAADTGRISLADIAAHAASILAAEKV